MGRVAIHATPSVALVGRKNVGKSSLFNRLTETGRALVSKVPGTTRDVGIGHARWRGKVLTVLDTGGLDIVKRDEIEENVRKQALRAAQKSHLIVFVVDAETGPLAGDRLLARELRKAGPPVVLTVNKADSPAKRRAHAGEWLKLGCGEPVYVSAATGSGSGDLLDRVFEALERADLPLEAVKPDAILALIGRPNVGKSSILNAMAGEERVIVSEVAHTTREPQDTVLFYDDRPILVVDTAGIRKRANVERGLESAGVKKSLDAIERADVVFVVLDVTEGVGIQDKHLAGLAAESGKGVILVLNKWDLIEGKGASTVNRFEEELSAALPFLGWAPMVFVSARSGQRVRGLLDLALRVRENRERVIPVEELDAFADTVVRPFVASRIPKRKSYQGVRKRHPYVYGLRQDATAPPSFSLIVKDIATVDKSYLRFVENRLRERFDLEGTPVRIHSREIEQ